MSGCDERPGIPKCPLCRREPEFWILNLDTPKCIWLFSERYLNKHPQFKKVTASMCRLDEWVNVRSIRCGHEMSVIVNHSFHKDIIESVNIVQKVLKQTKHYIDIGRAR